MAALLSFALTSIVDEIEVRSAFSPPLVIRLEDLGKPGPPNPYLKAARPTILIRGPAFRKDQVIAPYGTATATEWKKPATLAVGLGVLTAVVLLGSAFNLGRRSRR